MDYPEEVVARLERRNRYGHVGATSLIELYIAFKQGSIQVYVGAAHVGEPVEHDVICCASVQYRRSTSIVASMCLEVEERHVDFSVCLDEHKSGYRSGSVILNHSDGDASRLCR